MDRWIVPRSACGGLTAPAARRGSRLGAGGKKKPLKQSKKERAELDEASVSAARRTLQQRQLL